MRIPVALIAAMFLGYLLPVHAQQKAESHDPVVYKVEFDIRDGRDGASEPSQHFSMLVDESRKGVFQATNRLPVASGSLQRVDVGVNIECTVQQSEGKAVLLGGIELTGITGQVNLSGISQPIIGQRKMAFNITVDLSSPTVIIDNRNASAPNPASLNQTGVLISGTQAIPVPIFAMRQVEATVTKLN